MNGFPGHVEPGDHFGCLGAGGGAGDDGNREEDSLLPRFLKIQIHSSAWSFANLDAW